MVLHPKIQELKNKEGSSPIRKATPFVHTEQTRAAAKTEGRIMKQYFCIFGVKDDRGTMPIKGCFSKSINERGPDSKSTFKIPALYMHSQRDSVGLPIVLKEDDIGLYGEVPALEGVQVAEELLIRHRSGTCNNGSYGFDYVWDKMEYDETIDAVIMKEVDLFEITFCTIGSQRETYGVRSLDEDYTDDFLEEDTKKLLKLIPKERRLEMRCLIDRHITLAQNKPSKTLEERKPQHVGINIDSLIKKLKS